MRIIGGRFKGLKLNPPKNLPVRPTTDMAKEALFNILNNRLEFEGLEVLDLFSGTGGIALEFASRGAGRIEAVDRQYKCIRFLNDCSKKLEISSISTVCADVFSYLERCQSQFDFIFADPPYDLDKLVDIPQLVSDNNLLKSGGILVLEFPSTRKLADHPEPMEIRKYGNSSFAFYEF